MTIYWSGLLYNIIGIEPLNIEQFPTQPIELFLKTVFKDKSSKVIRLTL